MTAIAMIHKDEILEQVRAGRILREIAPKYGISPQAIHQVIGKLPEYRDAMIDQAASMIEEAKVQTWAAAEQVDIARAREVSRFAFRYAESVDPNRWAPRSHVQVEHTGDRADELRAAKARMVGESSIVDNPPQTVDK